MPDSGNQTQNGGAVATAPASSEGASNTTGSTSSQGTPAPQVDSGTAPLGNSGHSDNGDGSNGGEGDRSRPPRAERRISELTKQSSEWEKLAKDTGAENERLRKLLGSPIDEAKVNLQLPDYSKQDSVTPEQIAADTKKAVIDAADQIVRLRLGQLLPEAFAGQDLKRARISAVAQLREVSNPNSKYYHAELDPESERYEQDTDDFLAQTFERVFKADPTYSFRQLVEQHFKQRGGRGQSNINEQNGSDSKQSTTQQPTQALRGNPKSASTPHKPIAEMSAAEYRDYLRSRK